MKQAIAISLDIQGVRHMDRQNSLECRRDYLISFHSLNLGPKDHSFGDMIFLIFFFMSQNPNIKKQR